MDREWMYKQLDQVNKMLDVQVALIESLSDRVASLEECARVTPMKAVRRSRKQKDVEPLPF